MPGKKKKQYKSIEDRVVENFATLWEYNILKGRELKNFKPLEKH